jgi:peroxiredoxin (alkyl hydroperoxide reductase subunit C)
VTQQAPDFKADAVLADNSFGQIELSSYKGKYVYLLFYPLDFTFVCPSEILAFNKKLDEFKQRNCEIISVSVDSKYTHLAWKNTKIEDGGIGQIQFPMVADLNKEITKAYGIEHSASVALRGLFLIDPKGVVRHCVINDLALGRSVDEALRMLDALQFTDTHGDVCPANWKQGDEAMKPTAEGVASYLAKHGK